MPFEIPVFADGDRDYVTTGRMSRPLSLALLLGGYTVACFLVFPLWPAFQLSVTMCIAIPVILAATKPDSLLGAFRWFAAYKRHGVIVIGLTCAALLAILTLAPGQLSFFELGLQIVWVFFGFWMFGSVDTYRKKR